MKYIDNPSVVNLGTKERTLLHFCSAIASNSLKSFRASKLDYCQTPCMDGPSHVSSLDMPVKVRFNVSAPGDTSENLASKVWMPNERRMRLQRSRTVMLATATSHSDPILTR